MNFPRPLLFALACLPLIAALHAQETGKHVIFISADGMRPDAVDALGPEKAPTFFRLRKEGAWTSNARTDVVYTVTLPNHTAMITSRGVTGPEGHSWIKNSDPRLGENLHKNHKGYLSSVFAVAHDNGLSTALYASKSKFSLYDISYDDHNGAPDTTGEDNGRDKLDRYVMESETNTLVDRLVADLASDPADFIMLHLRDPDSAGHAESWNVTPGSPYLQAVARVDELVGRVLDAIEKNPNLKGNTWLILTADHGGLTGAKGHGESDEKDNFTIPYYVWGPDVPAGKDLYEVSSSSRLDPGVANPPYTTPKPPIRNGDSGNLSLSLLGLPAIPGSTINAQEDLVVREKHEAPIPPDPAATK
ncbi:MAG: alkaline phosphatase family protein [Verrucomicrobiae bacterium]|nr:alkaline phosphatase family protein [Verrucomicrobiae bacterium]